MVEKLDSIENDTKGDRGFKSNPRKSFLNLLKDIP